MNKTHIYFLNLNFFLYIRPKCLSFVKNNKTMSNSVQVGVNSVKVGNGMFRFGSINLYDYYFMEVDENDENESIFRSIREKLNNDHAVVRVFALKRFAVYHEGDKKRRQDPTMIRVCVHSYSNRYFVIDEFQMTDNVRLNESKSHLCGFLFTALACIRENRDISVKASVIDSLGLAPNVITSICDSLIFRISDNGKFYNYNPYGQTFTTESNKQMVKANALVDRSSGGVLNQIKELNGLKHLLIQTNKLGPMIEKEINERIKNIQIGDDTVEFCDEIRMNLPRMKQVGEVMTNELGFPSDLIDETNRYLGDTDSSIKASKKEIENNFRLQKQKQDEDEMNIEKEELRKEKFGQGSTSNSNSNSSHVTDEEIQRRVELHRIEDSNKRRFMKERLKYEQNKKAKAEQEQNEKPRSTQGYYRSHRIRTL